MACHGMIVIFYQDRALLKRRVRGIDRMAHQLFIPLPVGVSGPGKLGACESGCVEAYETFAFGDELLDRVLLLCGELKRGLVQLDKYLVFCEVILRQRGEIAGKVDVEVVFGGELLEERPGGFYHGVVVAVDGTYDEDLFWVEAGGGEMGLDQGT